MISKYWQVGFIKDAMSEREEKLNKIVTRKSEYSRGDIVHFEGDSITSVGFVLKGILKATNYTHSGKEQNVHYFTEGDILPEYMVLSGVKHYVYNLICERSAVLEWMNIEDFFQLMDSDISLLKSLLKYVANRAYQEQLILRCMSYHKAPERLAYYILNMNLTKSGEWIYIPYTQRILADHLNISRSVLNQTVIEFEKQGWIKRDKNRIKILSLEKLENLL